MISFNELKKMNARGNVIPLFEKLSADLDTPVSAFIKLALGKKESFLLESIEGGEKLARYSFIGYDPFLIVEADKNDIILIKGKQKSKINCPPIGFLNELFKSYQPVKVSGLPRFTGGGVGFFAYDTVRWIEAIPDNNKDVLNLPEMRLGIYKNIIAFDHLKQDIIIISNILHDPNERGLKKKYDQATKEIELSKKKLTTKLKRTISKKKTAFNISSNFTKKKFEAIVRKAKKYIKEGDIFQVVLSQRWKIKSNQDALSVYRNLRRLNPSPYMFLLNFRDSAIIGSSPEMMVRVEDGVIETRPIAGTRRRGKNEKEDEKLAAELLSDEKELAEHTMLIDLGRNDIGKVSTTGSVKLKDKMIIEKYSHVMHIVSSVVGKMKKNQTALDGHFSCFPAGTLSGAPKIRAMEIIDELEEEKRSVYGGSIAYLDFWGNLDSCIAIRTVVKKDDNFYVQAGAGIVADSRPAREYQETADKARAIIEAIKGDS